MSYLLLTLLAFVLYLIAAVCLGATVFLRSPAAPVPSSPGQETTARIGRVLALLGIITQFFAVGAWCMATHLSPFAGTFGTLSVAAWAIALTSAIIDFRGKMPAVSAITLLVACLLLFGGSLKVHVPLSTAPSLRDQIVSLHVLSILASFGLFALAFGCALLYLLQNQLLRGKGGAALFRRLPPLATLDTAAYHAIAYGLPLLTIGLALGFVRVFGGGLDIVPSRWFTDTHTIASLFVWTLYVAYLLARAVAGWRGVRLQYILLLGLAVALLLYFLPSATHRFT